MNNVAAVPSTNATTRIAQKATSPAKRNAAKTPIAAIRTPSETIIRRFRLQRSATTPAASENTPNGISLAKLTRPAFAAECVTASVSSG
jgi:hypothetical protein